MELNDDAHQPPDSGCLGYTLRDTLSRTVRIEKPQKSWEFGTLSEFPSLSASKIGLGAKHGGVGRTPPAARASPTRSLS